MIWEDYLIEYYKGCPNCGSPINNLIYCDLCGWEKYDN